MSNHVCVSRIVRCTAVAVVVGVFLLASSAQGAISNSFGITVNNSVGAGPGTGLNAGAGSGAEVLSTDWKNSTVQGSGGLQGTWTDGVLSVGIYNQTALSGATSFWNGGDPGAGTAINKGAGKTHYFSQNEKIAGLDTLGWSGVDIYVYGSTKAVIVSTNPDKGYGGTVVTNGAEKTMSYNGALTTYVNGAGGTGNYMKFSNITPLSNLWVSMVEGNWSAIQVVRAEIPIVSVAGDPGTPADWGTGTTWDLNPATPDATHTAYVRHTVSLSGAQAVSALSLDNALSDLRIEGGASLAATNAAVSNGSLLATGALNATTLAVSGGAATVNSGAIGTVNATAGTTSVGGGTIGLLKTSAAGTAVSGGSVTTVNVTGGSANLTGGTIGTVTASGGSTTLATQVGALNANSGSTILGGAGAGAVTANLKAGSTVDTQGNYVAISNKVTLNNGMQISVSDAPVSVDLQGAAGDNVGDASKVARLRLNGGKVTVYKPGSGPETLLMSEGFETNGQGTRYNSNTNLADPAVPANTAAANSWGRVTSVPTHTFYGNGSNPTEGSVMWLGEETQPLAGNRSGDTLERTASWLDFNAMSVAGKTGLRLTVDLMADGLANGSRGPETNDEFKIRVKNVDTGVSSDVEYLEGQANNPYKSKMPGSTTQLNTPGVAVSVSYDLGALSLTNTMQLTFAHSQNGGSGVEYLAFDNIKVYGKSIVADAIDMSLTSIELTADTTLDLGLANAASFFDVFLEVGATTPRTLRLTGANFGVVSGLATYFDVTANNNANVSLGTTDGTTYQDVVVIPEPATMSLLVLGGIAALIRRRNRR